MAGLTNQPATPGGSVGKGTEGGPPVDPRAVRVRLSGESHPDDTVTLRVGPLPAPLRMTNPTVGTGPLGGSSERIDGQADPDVRAQRRVLVDDEPTAVFLRPLGGDRFVLQRPGHHERLVIGSPAVGQSGARIREILVDGFRLVVQVESERIAALRERASTGRASSAQGGPLAVKAIIPGKVVSVSIQPGDTVTAGQQLLVVEAMKMQNELRAPRDGTIDRVGVAVGVTIEIGDLLVVIN